MATSNPSVVFDCNVFVQGMLNPHGIAAKCWRLVETEQIALFVSEEILREIADVLHRPAFQKLSANFTLERVQAFLDIISERAICLRNIPEEYRYPRDPKDEPYLNLAVVARADYVVSYDNDLLDLMEENDTGYEFRRRYPMLRIIEPAKLLGLLPEGQSGDAVVKENFHG